MSALRRVDSLQRLDARRQFTYGFCQIRYLELNLV